MKECSPHDGKAMWVSLIVALAKQEPVFGHFQDPVWLFVISCSPYLWLHFKLRVLWLKGKKGEGFRDHLIQPTLFNEREAWSQKSLRKDLLKVISELGQRQDFTFTDTHRNSSGSSFWHGFFGKIRNLDLGLCGKWFSWNTLGGTSHGVFLSHISPWTSKGRDNGSAHRGLSWGLSQLDWSLFSLQVSLDFHCNQHGLSQSYDMPWLSLFYRW